MAASIQNAFIAQYNNNITLASQQLSSRLLATVTEDSMAAETKFFERLGATTARVRQGRNTAVEYDEAAHSRRALNAQDYYNAFLFDNVDRIRMLVDPTSSYAMDQVSAIHRQIDSNIIASAIGTAFTGKTGTTPVTLPAGQVVAVDYTEAGTTGTNFNINWEKLRKARLILEYQEALMEGESPIVVISSAQKQSLLKLAETKNVYGNSIQSLESGMVMEILGFRFIRSELLTYSTGSIRQVLMYPPSAIRYAWLSPIKTTMDIIPTMHNAVQVYTSGSFGAARMFEERVVSILCDETKV